jgi:hypothetical protein
MEVLRNLFGNVTSGIIRLAVFVGILAAAYLFIVRPVLDTTNHAIDSANQSFENSFGKGSGLDPSELSKTIQNANKQVQIAIKRSFHVSKVHGNSRKLLHCVQAANGDVHKMQRCTRRF